MLEGFDFGVGDAAAGARPGGDAADTEKRRRVMLNTIGPHWDGNEVWLLTAGGATFAAFPEWYATMFCGFYLPLLSSSSRSSCATSASSTAASATSDARGASAGTWRSSAARSSPPLLVGRRLTNVVRGVPIDEDMEFVGNLFTLLNPMSLLGGLVILGLSSSPTAPSSSR